MKSLIRQSLILSAVLVIICGVLYPLTVTGMGQLLFNKKANGSFITYKGKVVGSELIGQAFEDKRFFHGRPSSINYNTYNKTDKVVPQVTSGSSNLGPSNEALKKRIEADTAAFIKEHPGITKSQIPADFMTNSGSGLDPDISIAAAEIQIPLISKATGIDEKELNALVHQNTKQPFLGIFGEQRVNVLNLNLAVSQKLK